MSQTAEICKDDNGNYFTYCPGCGDYVPIIDQEVGKEIENGEESYTICGECGCTFYVVANK